MAMTYSKDGLHLTEQFEGCRLVAYPDQGGVPTIGYGHTFNVSLGDTCTQEQAEAWLQEDIGAAVDVVNRFVKVPLTQGEFDALVDFEFNLGAKSLRDSTLLRLLNAGNYAGASEQFERWDKCNGQVVAGLLRRRLAEEAEFKAGMQ